MSYIILTTEQLTDPIKRILKFDSTVGRIHRDRAKHLVETDDETVLALVPEDERYNKEQIKVILRGPEWTGESRVERPEEDPIDAMPEYMRYSTYDELVYEFRAAGIDFKVEFNRLMDRKPEDMSDEEFLRSRKFNDTQIDAALRDTGRRV